MAISNVSINPPASSAVNSIVNNIDAPSVGGVQHSANKSASATVTLSTQGQKLNQSQTPSSQTQASSTANTAATSNGVPQSKETAAAPGIQFMQGERKGGRVNTFA
jgi:hypothetical protein